VKLGIKAGRVGYFVVCYLYTAKSLITGAATCGGIYLNRRPQYKTQDTIFVFRGI
jgi:hypothetical protein